MILPKATKAHVDCGTWWLTNEIISPLAKFGALRAELRVVAANLNYSFARPHVEWFDFDEDGIDGKDYVRPLKLQTSPEVDRSTGYWAAVR